MNYIDQFKSYLETSQKASTATVKNYLSDIRKFQAWIEQRTSEAFDVKLVTPELIEAFKAEMRNLSVNSSDRYISSLKKFYAYLAAEGIFTANPFLPQNPQETSLPTDPYMLKGFKNSLYELKAADPTIKNYLTDIKQFLAWAEEVSLDKQSYIASDNNLFSKLTTQLIEEYKMRLHQTAQLSPLSINRKLSSIRKYLAFLLNQGAIEAVPFVINTNKHDFSHDTLPSQDVFTDDKSQTETETLAAQNIPDNLPSHEQSQLSDTTPKPYSRFGPLRLFQRLGRVSNFIFDLLMILPLVKFIEQAQYLFVKLSGKGIFTAVEAKMKTAGLASRTALKAINTLEGVISARANKSEVRGIHHFITRDKKTLADFGFRVSNLPKEMYAPISVKNLPFHKKIWHHARFTRPNWYRKYHSFAITHYFHFAILMIVVTALGVGVYNGVFNKARETKTLAAAVSPPRILSFQGRLTDNSDNPITATTNLRFALYNDTAASGAALLWQEVKTTAPDTDGIFNVYLGQGTAIPANLFTDNASVYLGITVGTNDTELTPRQQIATVAYASNAESLQGMRPTTDGTAGTTNVVLALDSAGNLTIGGSATPVFKASGGQLTLSGTVLQLTTNVGTNSNILLSPDGLGKIDVQKALVNSTLNSQLPTAAGAVNVDDLFAVNATSSGQSLVTLNQNGAGPLISASVSGVAKFTVDNSGNGTFAGDVAVNGGDITTSNTTGTIFNSAINTLQIGGAASSLTLGASSGTLNLQNPAINLGAGSATTIQTTSNSLLTIGGNTTGNIVLSPGNGAAGANISPSTNNQVDLGTATFAYRNLYVSNIIGASAGINGYWQRFGNAVSPANITDDVLLGATATASALIKLGGTTNALSYFNTGGNVAIGGTSASYQLDVKGNTNSFVATRILNSNGGASAQSALLLGNDSSATAGQLYLNSSGNSTNGAVNSLNLYQSLSAALNFWTNGTQRQTITENGNVGIGTATPTSFLDIRGSTSTNNALVKLVQSGTADIFTASTGATTKFTITNGGNVGIGTTTIPSLLTVNGTTTGNALATFVQNTVTGDILTASAGAATKFVINNNGNVGIGSSVPTALLAVNGGAGIVGQFSGRVSGGNAVSSNEFVTLSQLNGTNYWQLNNGAIEPFSNTLDLLIGGTATTSAKFAFINNTGSGAPTASISGNLSIAVPTGANPSTLYTAFNGGTINFQTSAGGDAGATSRLFIQNNGNIGIGTTTVGSALEVNTPSSSSTVIIDNNSSTVASGLQIADKLTATNVYSSVLNPSGTGNSNLATVPLSATFQTGSGTTGGLIFIAKAASSPIIFATGGSTFGSERMRIDGTGNVGIGSTAPTAKLDIAGDASTSGSIVFNGTNKSIDVMNGSRLDFTTSPGGDAGLATKMTLLNNGNLGIGSATPAQLLDVSGGSGIVAQFSGRVIGGNAISSNEFITLSQLNASNYWQLINGALSPFSSGLDVLIGGNATASAKIKLSGTPGDSFFNTGGNLGIGTTTPKGFLDVRGSTGNNNALVQFVQSGSADIFTASTGATTKFVINNNGNVGIGSSLPSASLDIASAANTTGLNISGYSLTGSNSQALMSLTGTWNTSAANPMALFLNIQDTSSNANSYLMELETSNTMQFRVRKDGAVFVPNQGIYFATSTAANTFMTSNNLQVTSGVGPGSPFVKFIHNNSNVALQINSNSDILMQPSAGNVGIGTTSPLATLDVRGSLGTIPFASISGQSTFAGLVVDNTGVGDLFTASKSGATKFVVKKSGNVGIGTSLPTQLFDVEGGTGIVGLFSGRVVGGNAVNSNEFITLSQLNASNYWQLQSGALSPFSSTLDVLTGSTATASALVKLPGTNNTNAFFNLGTGNLGVGTTNPTGGKLEVNGNVLADVSTGGGYYIKDGTTATTERIFGTASSGQDLHIASDWSGNGTTGNLYVGYGMDATNKFIGLGYGTTSALHTTVKTGANTILAEDFGNVGIGTTTMNSKLHVYGTTTGNSLVTFDQRTSGGDILTASASGTPVLQLDYNGNLGIGTTNSYAKFFVNSGSQSYGSRFEGTNPYLAFFQNNSSSGLAYGIYSAVNGGGGSTHVGAYLTASGATNNYALTTGLGNVGIGTTAPDFFALQVAGNAGPDITDTYDLGSASKEWNNVYTKSLYLNGSLINPAGLTNYWQRALGAVSPANITDDVLVGGIATASAKIRLGGTTNADSFFNTGGNLGIGTSTPNKPLTFLSTTATGTIVELKDISMTSGTLLNLIPTSATALTGNSDIMNVSASSFDPGSGNFGDAGRFSFNNLSTNTSGTSTVSGVRVVPSLGTILGASGTTETHGIYVSAMTGFAVAGGTINNYGVRIQNQGLTNATTAYGLYVEAQSGATNNYSAIFAGGNVGIGTTSPQDLFNIYAGSSPYLMFGNTITGNTTSDGSRIGLAVAGDLEIRQKENLPITFFTANSEKMRLDNLGNLGIGTTTPVGKVNIVTDPFNLTGKSALTIIQNENADLFTASAGATTKFVINNLGNVGIGTSIPLAALDVRGQNATTPIASFSGSTNWAGLLVDNGNANGDLITASRSGSMKLTVTGFGDLKAGNTVLDGTTTANGAGTNSNTLILTSAASFDVGNYVQVSSTNCVAGVNICYAKITGKATNTLTISPSITWANGSTVSELHIAEIGGTDLAQTNANRYGRGYFVDGIVTGNGSTYYTDRQITLMNNDLNIVGGNVIVGTSSALAKFTVRQDGVSDLLTLRDGSTGYSLTVASGGAILSKPTAFAKVFSCAGASCTTTDSGAFTENTGEASTSAGLAFTTIGSGTTATFYVGLDKPFASVYFSQSAAATGVTLVREYWNGSTWAAMPANSDETLNMTISGKVSFPTMPADWALKTVNNSGSLYYMRFRSSTNVTAAPTALSVSPTTGSRFTLYAQNGDAPNSPALHINDTGNIGVNTIAPSDRLAVNGNIQGSIFKDYENTSYYLDPANATTSLITAGNVGIGSTSTNLGAYASTSKVLSVLGGGTQGVVEIGGTTADADATSYGDLAFVHNNTTDSEKRLSIIRGATDGATANNRGGQLQFYVQNNGANTFTQAMTIRQDGNVGIGTTTAANTLNIKGDGTGIAQIGVGCSGSNYAAITLNRTTTAPSACTDYNILSGPSDSNLYFNRPTSKSMNFRQNNVDQMVIDTAGNVGIGTSAAFYPLHVKGSSWLARFGTTGSTSVDISGNQIQAINNAAGSPLYLNFSNGGNVGVGTTTTGSTLTVGGSFGTTGASSIGTTETVNGEYFYQNYPTQTAHTAIGYMGTLLGTGIKGVVQYFGSYVYPGRADGGAAWNTSWYLGSHASYGLYTNTGMYFAGAVTAASNVTVSGAFITAGNTAFNGTDGWVRTYGNAGWYNGTYSGGMYMTDSSYLRNYNGVATLLATSNTSLHTFEADFSGAADKVAVVGRGGSSGRGVYGESTGSNIGVTGVSSSGYGVYCSGTCGGTSAWTPPSDIRLKQDINTITNGLDKIMRLRPVTYHWKNPNFSEDVHVGFIAQEVLPVFPEAIGIDKTTGYYNMEQGNMSALAILGIKEQQYEIASMSAAIASLPANAPEFNLASTGDVELLNQGNDTFTIQYKTDSTYINRIVAFASAVIGNLKAGAIDAQKVTTQALTLGTENVTIAGQSLKDYILGVVSEANLSGNYSGGSLPELTVLNMKTNLISPLASESAVVVNGRVFIAGNPLSTAPSLEVQGNASISGQLATNSLTTNDATISGTLHAGKIIADDIEGLTARLATLSATTIFNTTNVYNSASGSAQTASGSGQIDPAFQNGIPTLLSANIQTQYANIASLSGQFAQANNLQAEFGQFNQGLISLGPTSLSDTSVMGQLSVGGNMILADNTINVLGADLQLQPLKQGGVSFEGGLIAINTDGDLTVGGSAVFKKDVRIDGTLAVNFLSPVPNTDLTVKLPAGTNGKDSQFIIQNASGSGVLAVDQKGNVTASGSGFFSQVASNIFNIVRGAQADTSVTETTASGSAGTAVIKRYYTERTIYSPFVTEKSLIYVTATSDTQGQTPYIARQTAEDISNGIKGSFTISIPTSVSQDIKINWWIVN